MDHIWEDIIICYIYKFLQKVCFVSYIDDLSTILHSFSISKMMFENEMLAYFSQFDSHGWRKNVLWREEVDFTLKVALEPLRNIYKRYIGKNALPGAP